MEIYNNFSLVQSDIETDFILDVVNKNPSLWDFITARQDHSASPHRETQSIFLRWSQEMSVHTVFTDIEAVDYPVMDIFPQLKELLFMITRAVGATELGRVLLVRLKPKGIILKHTDEGAYADYYERFHLPIKSNMCLFYSEVVKEQERRTIETEEFVNMRPGELWWFDHKKPHRVQNFSETERIHLIIDCVAPKYRRERE